MPKTDEYSCILVSNEALNRRLTCTWKVNGDLVETHVILATSHFWAESPYSRSARWLARTLPGGLILAVHAPERYIGDPGSLDVNEGLSDG